MSQTIAESVPHGYLRQTLHQAQCFQISNIARYMISESDEEYEGLMQQIPCIKLPFPTCWVEYEFPDTMRTKKHGVVPMYDEIRGGQLGMLMVEDKKPTPKSEFFYMMTEENSTPEALEITRSALVSDQNISTISTRTCLAYRDGSIREAPFTRIVLIGTETRRYAGMVVTPPVQGSDVFPFFETVMFWAIGMLHCRNVKSVPLTPSRKQHPANRKERRAQIRFHVLKVEVPTRTRATSSTSSTESTGRQFSAHICRGHFKDFREKGLFGKNKGVYWWSPQLRGDEQFGMVDKTYEADISE